MHTIRIVESGTTKPRRISWISYAQTEPLCYISAQVAPLTYGESLTQSKTWSAIENKLCRIVETTGIKGPILPIAKYTNRVYSIII